MVFYEDNELLFSKADLDRVLRSHFQQIGSKIDATPKDQFFVSSDDDLINHIRDCLWIDHLEIHEESMEMDQDEIKVDVSRDRDRNPFQDRGPIYIDGIRVTVTIPFTGDV